MKKNLKNISKEIAEKSETEFKHNFATERYTQEAEDCYSVEWIYENGLRAHSDAKIHFTDIQTIWNLRSNDFEVVFIVKSNNAISNWDCDDLKKWADNGFKGIKAIVVKGEGSNLWHYITPKSEDYFISRGYATCEVCIRELLFA